MKEIYRRYLILFSLATCLFASCADEDIINGHYIIEGEPAEVELTFNVDVSDEIVSRAAQSTYYEYLVQNIYVFVFSNGNRVALDKSFFDADEITNYKNKEDQNNNTQSSGTINFGSISGAGLQICAIANIGTSNSKIETNVLDGIKTYQDLKNLSVELRENTIFRGGSFLMTGEVTDDLKPNTTTTVTIPLKRTDSKVTFNVSAESNSQNIKDMQFIPGRWRVVNVPKTTWVLPPTVTAGNTLTSNLDAGRNDDHYFSILESEMPQFEGAVEDTENSGTFTFYMYENLKAPNDNIGDDDVPVYTASYEGNAKYALREKQTKTGITDENRDQYVPTQRFINGEYVFAPEYGTYVVFTGELSYTDNSNANEPKYVMADVEYCVHLGHSGTSNVNDYSTFRNSYYTYNITITGVNSLIVEVDTNDGTNDQEERPGAEGDVVISASEIINVDAHYDRALITLTPEEAEKLFFAVNTPWERGLDTNGFLEVGNTTLKDYKWVKFLINSEAGVANNRYAAFPGEQCYDGGISDYGTAKASVAYNNGDVVLRDIRQLSNYLSQNPPSSNTVITAFIDEYLYFYNPMKDDYKAVNSTNPDLTLWKQSVNQKDRMLHIVKAGDMNYSADGETSVSRSVVTIKQRPILTFYNVNAEGLSTAWGTETINETPRKPITRSSFPTKTTSDNYYTYAQKLASRRNNTSAQSTWSYVISASEQYGLGTDYNDVSYACAMRNRDFDGDGTIDTDEIIWYQTSIDQLTDLWIGEPAMPSYAYLFDPNNVDGTYTLNRVSYGATHYASSTIHSTQNSPYVYWAEEYGAISSQYNAAGGGGWNNKAPTNNGTQIASVRCVRNLGKSYDSTELPQDYVVIEGGTPQTAGGENSTTNEYTLRLEYMNPIALRSNPETGPVPYDLVDTQNENNRPYVSFSVLPSSYGNNGINTNTTVGVAHNAEQTVTTTDNICPDGYRIPNQREMLLMKYSIDGWNWNSQYNTGYMVRNRQNVYDINGTFREETVFFLNTYLDSFSRYTYSTNTTTRVRCVRDVQ